MPKTAVFTKFRFVYFLAAFVVLSSCGSSITYDHASFRPDTVDAGNIRFAKNMYRFVQVNVREKNSTTNEQLQSLEFSDSLPRIWRNRFPPSVIEKELFLRFYLSNSGDSTQKLFFYPGAYFNSITIFEKEKAANKYVQVSIDSTPPKWRLGFRQFDLAARDTAAFLVRLNVLRSTATLLYPIILQKDFVEPFVAARVQGKKVTTMFTYLVAGIMLMMILYSLAVYRLNRSKEFLYYSGYAFFIGLLLFLKSFLLYDYTRFNFFFESYWDFLVQGLAVAFYLQFVRHFLDTKRRDPFLEKTFRLSEYFIGALLAVYTVLYFFTDNFIWLDFFENFTKQFLLLIGVIFVIYGIRKHDSLMQWLVWGNILLILFSIFSFVLIVTPFSVTNSPSFSFLNDAILYYEFGLALELIMFLGGLAFKNRRDIVERTRYLERLKMENERKELEKQMAVLAAQQDERDRISADMHDELGSGVTAIRLMSEIVKSKMKEATLPEVEKISMSANDLITKMNTIIWTMTSTNDTIESLVTYIRTYAFEFFESTSIDCKFTMPDLIPRIELSGERRRNIFLAVKEALNNVVKHSKATAVKIDIKVNEKLVISIADNGLGIDLENLRRFGNGMKNMQARLENINGRFNIFNNHGTITIFEINL